MPVTSAFSSTGFTGCGKTQNSVILSEAKNLSLFLFLYLNRREILRFAQNDRTRPFFRSLFSLLVFCGSKANHRPRRLKTLWGNSISNRPGAKAALILQTLRHG